jgi:CHASE1-domain containing sensor protein
VPIHLSDIVIPGLVGLGILALLAAAWIIRQRVRKKEE